jgi:putative ABC transport system ATP-binding protein
MPEELIKVAEVSKIYRTGDIEVQALHALSLVIGKGEFTAIAGPSGSGKTTLLNIMSGLDIPTTGRASQISGVTI